jgi:hypothetical protein
MTGQWIPVSKQLPEDGVRVLVYDGVLVYDADYSYDYGAWEWGAEVTYWMPLPEPPDL